MNNRIFLSGPITGISDYKDNFKDAAFSLQEARRNCSKHHHCSSSRCPFYSHNHVYGCTIHDVFPDYLEIVNPATLGLDGVPWLWCMAVCIFHLLRCHRVYMLSGWWNSRGARIEHRVAKFFGKLIIYQKPK